MKTTRRRFIAGISGTAVTAIPAAATANSCGEPTTAQENPVLLAAHARFLAAVDEHSKARDALEWLADEWRHRWPVAPEAILGGANADNRWAESAERDIIGRYVYRDTSRLTKRFTKKQRECTPRACFSVDRPASINASIVVWSEPRIGRTPEIVARKIIEQRRILAELREKLRLSEAYYAEITTLRELADVRKFKDRITAAEVEKRNAAAAVSKATAFTTAGLRIKAETMKIEHAEILRFGGVVADAARLIESVLSVTGGSST
ncbi:hypothetical protein [Shinella kummerowiae]|uniref:hypothetical protein n=1 Tax=Shinella kummerowiae TaxID=417745 RepID=UPI0021B5C5B8|nr:hypothetical protein [Shinella kummerowiae]MCT7665692.1 hypothetical protein [Shinella kummerowiae]